MDGVLDFFLSNGRENEFPITVNESKGSPYDLLKLTVTEKTPQDSTGTMMKFHPTNSKPLSDDIIKKLSEKIPLEKQDEKPVLVTKEGKPKMESNGSQISWPSEEDFKKEESLSEAVLRVTHHFPEGKIFAPPAHFSVTFSQPILDDQKAYFEILPPIKGTTRFAGANTLIFEPSDKFPCATEFLVKITHNVMSVYGTKLTQDFKFSFATPPPRLVDYLPGSITVAADPLFFLQFDQQVVPNKVFEYIKLVDGSLLSFRWSSYKLILLEVDQVKKLLEKRYKKDKLKYHEQNLLFAYEKRLAEAINGRFLWFTVEKPLPLDYRYYVQVLPGCPSAEGSLLTGIEQGFKFKTYSPLKIESHEPSAMPCLACQPWTIRFSNPLAEIFDETDLVRINPPLEGMKVSARGPYINISGRSVGSTTYTVTFTQRLVDVFGQKYLENKVITFEVGESPQLLTSFQSGFLIHDASRGEKPLMRVVTCNIAKLRVLMFHVDPEKDFEKCPLGPAGFSSPIDLDPISYVQTGKLILDTVVATDAYEDHLTEVDIDLYEVLQHKKELIGQVLVYVEPNKSSWKGNWRFRPRIVTWVQCTRLALDFFTNQGYIYSWVNSLKDGAPIKDAEFTMLDKKIKANENGLAVFKSDREVPIIAKQGSDVVFLNVTGKSKLEKSTSELYLVGDKTVYRPKDASVFRGIIRLIENGNFSCSVSIPEKNLEIKYTFKDSKGVSLYAGKTNLNDFGAFEIKYQFPAETAFGTCTLILECKLWTRTHKVEIQNHSRDSLKLTTCVNKKEFLIGGSAVLTANQETLHSPVSGSPVVWTIKQERAVFTPPGLNGYTFQKAKPIHWDYQEKLEIKDKMIVKGATDVVGQHVLYLDFKPSNFKESVPVLISAECSLSNEVYGQTMTSTSSLIIHPSPYYVGIKPFKCYGFQNQRFPFEVIVCEHDGTPIKDISVAISLKKQLHKLDLPTDESFVEGFIIKSSDKAVMSSFTIERSGFYTIYASIQDEKSGLSNSTAVHLCIQGKLELEYPFVTKNQVILIPDKDMYKAGEKAELFIQVPLPGPCEIFTILSGESIFSRQFFTLKNSSQVIKLSIEKDHIPNIYVDVYAVGKTSTKTGYAHKRLQLNVCSETNSNLNMNINKYLTSGKLDVEVTSDADCEITLLAIQEDFVLQTGFKIQNPHSIFYAKRRENVFDNSTRSKMFVKDWSKIVSQLLVKTREFPATSDEEDLPDLSTIRLKPTNEKVEDRVYELDVKSLANYDSWMSTITTKSKKAVFQIPISKPDSKYRIWAISNAQQAFGMSEVLFAPNSRLAVNPMIPKTLYIKDSSKSIVVIENKDDVDHDVEIVFGLKNLKTTGALGHKMTIKKQEKASIVLPLEPLELIGQGIVKIHVQTCDAKFSWTSNVKVNVCAPDAEVFTLQGQLTTNQFSKALVLPQNVVAGDLQVLIGTKAIETLYSTFMEVYHFSPEGTEAIASKIIAISSFKSTCSSWGISESEFGHVINDLIQRLSSLQKANGGWSNYNKISTHPYISLHSIQALVLARFLGYSVNERVMKKAKNYMSSLDNEFKLYKYLSETTKYTLRAYSLYLLCKLNDRMEIYDKAVKLMQESNALDKFHRQITYSGICWLILTIYESGNKSSEYLNTLKSLLKTPDLKEYEVDIGAELFHTPLLTYTILLKTMMEIGETSNLNDLVTWLLGERVNGAWATLHENAYGLASTKQYMDAHDHHDSKSSVKMWIGSKYLDSKKALIPFSTLKEALKDDNLLVIQKDGTDPIWYYVCLNLSPIHRPLDRGFAVNKKFSYVSLKDAPFVDASGKVYLLAGEAVKITLTVVNSDKKHHVTIQDEFPQGLHFLYPEMQPTPTIPHHSQKVDKYWFCKQSWFEHLSISTKVELYASSLWSGSHEFSYVVCALLEGEYFVPSTLVKEITSPDSIGKSKSGLICITTRENIEKVKSSKVEVTQVNPFKQMPVSKPFTSSPKPKIVMSEPIKKVEPVRLVKPIGFKPVEKKQDSHVIQQPIAVHVHVQESEDDKKKRLERELAEKQRQEELTRWEEERLKISEEKRSKDETKKLIEARIAERERKELEQAKQDEELRLAIEAKIAERDKALGITQTSEDKLREREKKKLAEEKRVAEELSKAEELRRIANEKRLAEEKRLDEEKKFAEQKRKAEEARVAEERRVADERKRAEEELAAEKERMVAQQELEKRLAQEARVAEEKRLLEQKSVEEQAKIREQQRIAEESRIAEEKRIQEELRLKEEAKLAEEARIAQEKRIAEEKLLAEVARLAEEKRLAEEAIIAEEKRLEEEKKEQERIAEAKRLEEEAAARKQKEEDEKKAKIAAEVERRRKEAQEKIRKQKEDAERLKLEEEERIRKEQQEAEAERSRLEEEEKKQHAIQAEKKRIEEEEEERLKREAEQVEKKRLAEEAEKKRLEEERLKCEQEAEIKRQAEEAERIRLEEEKKKQEAQAERIRLEEEEKKKREQDEAEKLRLQEEKKQQEDEAERIRLKEEKKKKLEAEAERIRLEEEHKKQLEAEVERIRLEEEKKKAEEADRLRIEEEKKKAAAEEAKKTAPVVEDGYGSDGYGDEPVKTVEVKPVEVKPVIKEDEYDDGYGEEEPIKVEPPKPVVVVKKQEPKPVIKEDEYDDGYGDDEPKKEEPKKIVEDQYDDEYGDDSTPKKEEPKKPVSRFASIKLAKKDEPVIGNKLDVPVKTIEKRGSFLNKIKKPEDVKKEEAKKEEPKKDDKTGDGYDDEYE